MAVDEGLRPPRSGPVLVEDVRVVRDLCAGDGVFREQVARTPVPLALHVVVGAKPHALAHRRPCGHSLALLYRHGVLLLYQLSGLLSCRLIQIFPEYHFCLLPLLLFLHLQIMIFIPPRPPRSPLKTKRSQLLFFFFFHCFVGERSKVGR